jgi:hypothetical protein
MVNIVLKNKLSFFLFRLIQKSIIMLSIIFKNINYLFLFRLIQGPIAIVSIILKYKLYCSTHGRRGTKITSSLIDEKRL